MAKLYAVTVGGIRMRVTAEDLTQMTVNGQPAQPDGCGKHPPGRCQDCDPRAESTAQTPGQNR